MAAYVYIDVSQKQEYIYKNSKLKDNLYNSFIIKAVTERLTKDILQNSKTLDEDLKDIVLLQKYLEDNYSDTYTFEYSGGGNSIIRFNKCDDAESFVKDYSYEVLKKHPDLELYISLVQDNDSIEYAEIRKTLIDKSDKLKDQRNSRFKRWSYGVEQIGENGKPVTYDNINKNEKLVRQFLYKKLEDKLKDTDIKITIELQDYKKQASGKSYIGVIAIDGNKMGDMVKEITSFEELKSFSEEIERIYFKAIVQALSEYNKKINKQMLITPILQAGDDICIIVEAEHAIQITADIITKIQEYSQLSNNKTLNDLKKKINKDYLTACGGVSIVKYSYPFFEAVKIAESLCHKAKEAAYGVKEVSKDNLRNSFINWEIVQSQVETELEYESYVKKGSNIEKFHIKPLCIDQNNMIQEDIFSYKAFNKIINKIIKANKDNENTVVSSSILEGLKKHIYGGIEQYRLYLDMRQAESRALINLITEVLKGEADQYMTINKKTGNETIITYILNDILEALPFMENAGGEQLG